MPGLQIAVKGNPFLVYVFHGLSDNKSFLKNPSGNYKGYPFRTYGGSSFLGGYSDHFPVYMFLVIKASWGF